VGTTHAITPGGAVFSSGSASNYSITYINGTLEVILPGDLDGNVNVDLMDAILALQVMNGIHPDIFLHFENDIGENKKIGMEDMLYIIQKAAGIR
jgi:hypothetical protein